MAESQLYEVRGRSTHAEKLVERCMDRQWGNSDVGNRGKNFVEEERYIDLALWGWDQGEALYCTTVYNVLFPI